MNNEELELLISASYLVIDGCMIGNAPPKLQARNTRLRNPQPGDWVIEMSKTPHHWPNRHSVGRLIMVREEPYHDWGDDADEPAPTEKYWYIEDIDGALQKWYDCQFYMLYTVEDLAEDHQHAATWWAERQRPTPLEESRAIWARDAAFRHGLLS